MLWAECESITYLNLESGERNHLGYKSTAVQKIHFYLLTKLSGENLQHSSHKPCQVCQVRFCLYVLNLYIIFALCVKGLCSVSNIK